MGSFLSGPEEPGCLPEEVWQRELQAQRKEQGERGWGSKKEEVVGRRERGRRTG